MSGLQPQQKREHSKLFRMAFRLLCRGRELFVDHWCTVREKGFSGGRKKLVREILQYLVGNPEAKDTIEGIRACWLTEGSSEEGLQAALDQLVSRGWLTRREITPSEIIYGVNAQRLEEIKAFLSESETEES
jgi:hypothetical protein